LALSVPFESLRQVDLGGAALGSTEALVALLGLSWALRVAASRDRASLPRTLLVPLVLLLTATAATTLRATALGPALKEGIRWLEVVVVYVVGVDLLREPRRRAIALGLLLAAGMVEAFLGYGQFLLRMGPPAFRTGGFLRAYGTFGQPNPYAGYLGTLLPLALALALCGWRERDRIGRALTVLVAAVFVALLGALLASMSRGGWLGFAFAVAVIASLFDRRALMAALAGLAGGVLIVFLGAFNLLPAQISERLMQVVSYFGVFDVRTVTLTPANWAVVERMAIWQAAWGMFESHPFLGVGPGNYAVLYDQFAMPGWKESMGHAHNLYLNLLAETGAIGLCSFLVFWAAAILMVWRRHRAPAREATWWQRAVPLGVLGVLAQVSLHNMFDNLMVHGLNVQLALLLALATWSGDEGGKVVPECSKPSS
jgi:O-antigen ligase